MDDKVKVRLYVNVESEVEVEMPKAEWEALDKLLDERGVKYLSDEEVARFLLPDPEQFVMDGTASVDDGEVV